MNGTFDPMIEDFLRHKRNNLDTSSELYSLNSGLLRQQMADNMYFQK